jgi:hypothetical protein
MILKDGTDLKGIPIGTRSRKGLFVLLFLILFFIWWFGGCKPKAKDLPGVYEQEGGFADITYRLDSDGTFKKFDGAREAGYGRWHLTDEQYLFDTGVELDQDGEAKLDGKSAGGSADEYRLTSRNGRICWEVRREFEYWCKIDASK